MKNFKRKSKSLAFKVLAVVFTTGMFTACQEDDFDDGGDDCDMSDYSYVQIATGQTTLYDADGAVVFSLTEGSSLYGQDASYLKGATMNYMDNGDGTVSDNNTG